MPGLDNDTLPDNLILPKVLLVPGAINVNDELAVFENKTKFVITLLVMFNNF